jgi:hypothetical protein
MGTSIVLPQRPHARTTSKVIYQDPASLLNTTPCGGSATWAGAMLQCLDMFLFAERQHRRGGSHVAKLTGWYLCTDW